MSTVTEILDHALQLAPADRGLIAHRLIISLETETSEEDQNEIDAAWESEILRRSEDLRSGRVQGIDGRESVARIRDALEAGEEVVKLIVHPDAQNEALNAALYYQGLEPSLGDDLRRQYERITEALAERPERYPLLETIRTQTVRRARLKRFPYMVVYEIVGEDVFLIAFAHVARRPNYWRSRRNQK